MRSNTATDRRCAVLKIDPRLEWAYLDPSLADPPLCGLFGRDWSQVRRATRTTIGVFRGAGRFEVPAIANVGDGPRGVRAAAR